MENKSTKDRLANAETAHRCAINVSVNGEYDDEGDPEPGREYEPCAKAVRDTIDGEPRCARNLGQGAAVGTGHTLVEDAGLDMLEARSELLEIVSEDYPGCIEHFEDRYPQLVERARLGEEDNIV